MLLANCRPFVSSFSRGRSLPNSFSSIYTSAAEGRKAQKQCRSNFGEFCDDFGEKLLSTGFKKTAEPASAAPANCCCNNVIWKSRTPRGMVGRDQHEMREN